MARVARRRGAKFTDQDGVKILNADSAAILAATAEDIATWLGFASVAEYDAATADERRERLYRARGVADG